MKISQNLSGKSIVFESDKGADRHEPGYHPHAIRAFLKHLNTAYSHRVCTLFMKM